MPLEACCKTSLTCHHQRLEIGMFGILSPETKCRYAIVLSVLNHTEDQATTDRLFGWLIRLGFRFDKSCACRATYYHYLILEKCVASYSFNQRPIAKSHRNRERTAALVTKQLYTKGRQCEWSFRSLSSAERILELWTTVLGRSKSFSQR